MRHYKREEWEPMDWQDSYLIGLTGGQDPGVVVLTMKDYLDEFSLTFEGVKHFKVNLQRLWSLVENEPILPAIEERGEYRLLRINGYGRSGRTEPLFEIEFQTVTSDRN